MSTSKTECPSKTWICFLFHLSANSNPGKQPVMAQILLFQPLMWGDPDWVPSFGWLTPGAGGIWGVNQQQENISLSLSPLPFQISLKKNIKKKILKNIRKIKSWGEWIIGNLTDKAQCNKCLHSIYLVWSISHLERILIGYMQILCHFILGKWVSMDLAITRGGERHWGQGIWEPTPSWRLKGDCTLQTYFDKDPIKKVNLSEDSLRRLKIWKNKPGVLNYSRAGGQIVKPHCFSRPLQDPCCLFWLIMFKVGCS